MEAIGLLAGGIAHDFSNLLTALSAYTHQAQQALPDDHKAGEALRHIEETTEQATSVTKSLLTFSHRTPANKERLNLREPVENAGRFLERVMPPSIEMVMDLDTPVPLEVLADGTQIQQVVMNLAINARDAMPQGGTLRVALSPQPSQGTPSEALLVVSDSGVGMSKETQERIFEPFYTTKERTQGTGLGLSIIHAIVEEHDGRIIVDSEVGKGTTFTIGLPLVPPRDPSSDEQTLATPRQGAGELILLAEYNLHIRRIMVESLRSLNYEVLLAEDGQSLLQGYDDNRERIRLLVIDVNLPQKDSQDCLEAIRARGGDVPAIILAGQTDVRLDDAIDEHTLVLRKPFHISEFGALVGRMIEPDTHRESEI
jgi:CheY-like chemotaxis protein